MKLGDIEVYISKPAKTEGQTSLLVLLSNGVGIHSINNQIQADHFARVGYFVVMPDMFNGDPAPNAAKVTLQSEGEGLLERIMMATVEGAKGFVIDMWLARHTPETTMPILEKVLDAVKEQYGDKSYIASLGTSVVGYCYGGKYALRLAATDLITAAAVAHGTMITKDDLGKVKKPVTLACVEHDPFFPDHVREEGQKFLAENKIEHELRLFKDVPHGFAVYGSYTNQNIKESQEEVFDQFVQFLSRH